MGLILLSAPLFVQAQILPKCDPLPGAAKMNDFPDCTVNSLFALLVNIYNFLLGLAGLVLLLMIIYGGFKMLIFYLGLFDSPEKDLEGAKHTISQAIWGFVIIAMAYLIVNTLVFTLLGVNGDSGVGKLLRQYF